jgi:GH25 family lysozyme M1 (1,4-beta-N-acetylmuramidase)
VKRVGVVACLALASCASDAREHREHPGESTAADTTTCPQGTLPAGVDVSDGQGTIDWTKVKAAGISWTVIKATQGTYNVQAGFAANWKSAKAAGVARAAYHFFDPTEDGTAQAQKFLDTVGPLDADDLSPMLDIECPDGNATCLGFSGGSGTAPAADIRTRMLDWLNAVEAATGRKPGIYSFGSYFSSNAIDTTGLDAYPLWIASLSTTCATFPPPWKATTAWQWSFTGTVSGINGQVDEDRMVAPMDALRFWPEPPRAAGADLDGDGKADACARSANGVTCALAGGGKFADGPAWSDAQGWRPAEYASTLRLGDVDGDGKSDVCARAAAGLTCAISTGSAFSPPFPGPAWSDAQGWAAPMYYTTIELADVDGDGKADACARGAAGITCARSNGKGFDPEVAGPAWSDANGWTAPDRYRTIRFGDIDGDGKADVCGRSSDGLHCAISTGTGFGPDVAGPGWSDAAGWSEAAYASTIRLADVDGDGKADVCARAAAGITCARSNGHGFDPPFSGPAWSDANGWSAVASYGTIVMLDYDGDGKSDVCGRASDGVHCALSIGTGFAPEFTGPAWSDANGWNEPRYALTMGAGDVNGDGRDDLCARGAAGLACAIAGGLFTGQATPLGAGTWSDANGFGVAPYWGTARVAGLARPRSPADAGSPGPIDSPPTFAGDAAVSVSASAAANGDASGGCGCAVVGQGDGDAGRGAPWLALGALGLALTRSARRRDRSAAGSAGSTARAARRAGARSARR